MRPLFVLATLAGVACSTQAVHPAELELARLSGSGPPFALTSGLIESGEYVVRDPATWEDVWTRMNLRRRPIPPPPAVDFATQMVVVVALGQQRSGGYSIAIDAAEQESGRIVVHVTSHAPAADCIVTSALTEPVDIALLPRSELPVLFERDAVTTACR